MRQTFAERVLAELEEQRKMKAVRERLERRQGIYTFFRLLAWGMFWAVLIAGILRAAEVLYEIHQLHEYHPRRLSIPWWPGNPERPERQA